MTQSLFLFVKVFTSLSTYQPLQQHEQENSNQIKGISEGKEADQKIERLNDAFSTYKPVFEQENDTHEVKDKETSL